MSNEITDRTLFKAAIAVFVVVLAGYIATLSPTVTFWDAGEFIATSYTLGIPHSPGTPLYVLLGRVFTLLPLPTVASITEAVAVDRWLYPDDPGRAAGGYAAAESD